MSYKEKFKEFAQTALTVGINLQKDQPVLVTAPIEAAEFVRVLAKEAYTLGAKTVNIDWVDEQITKIRFEDAPDSSFENYPEWEVAKRKQMLDEGTAFIAIHAEDPELLKNVDSARLANWTKVSNTARRENTKRLMDNECSWLVLSVPTTAYAKKVFPTLSDSEAIDKLWEEILKACRIGNGKGVENWQNHIDTLKKALYFLNGHKFKALKYTNADLSTNLTIELPELHVWNGGGDLTKQGLEFVANMPTEEVYTMPQADGVNGTIVSTKPLIYHGNMIDEFKLTFKDGVVVDYDAKVGKETLKNLLETDPGASRIGEVALVPYDSPISNSNLVFFNTLFDENAACHLAFGRAYASTLIGGQTMSQDELAKNGANDSLIHEDFMVGSKDLNIVGIKADGTEIPVFVDGNWASFN